MTLDQAGYAFIRSNEGCVLHPYPDERGVPTIGIGCIMYRSGKRVTMADPPITMDQAEDLFEWQCKLKTAVVNGLKLLFNQNQFNALSDFTYQEGQGALVGSTLVRLAKNNINDPNISLEFARWNKVKKIIKGVESYVVSPGITLRRKKDSDLYFTPIH